MFRRGLALWRDLRRAAGDFADAVDGVGRSLERTSAAVAAVEDVSLRAGPSVGRLDVSLARLSVLRAAIADVRAAADRVTGVYPRK